MRERLACLPFKLLQRPVSIAHKIYKYICIYDIIFVENEAVYEYIFIYTQLFVVLREIT